MDGKIELKKFCSSSSSFSSSKGRQWFGIGGQNRRATDTRRRCLSLQILYTRVTHNSVDFDLWHSRTKLTFSGLAARKNRQPAHRIGRIDEAYSPTNTWYVFTNVTKTSRRRTSGPTSFGTEKTRRENCCPSPPPPVFFAILSEMSGILKRGEGAINPTRRFVKRVNYCEIINEERICVQ